MSSASEQLRERMSSYAAEQLSAQATSNARIDVGFKREEELFDNTFSGELRIAGTLTVGPNGVVFGGDVHIAGELAIPLKHPALAGAKAFVRVEMVIGGFRFDLATGEADVLQGVTTQLSGGLRWSMKLPREDLELGSMKFEGRLELGIRGTITNQHGELGGALDVYGRARFDTQLGNWRYRKEANVIGAIYTSD